MLSIFYSNKRKHRILVPTSVRLSIMSVMGGHIGMIVVQVVVMVH